MADTPLFPPGESSRQARVAELVEEGHTLASAVGTTAAEEAGYTPPPAHGVDEFKPAQPRKAES